MKNLYDEYSWWNWAEKLDTTQSPTTAELEEAQKYPSHCRTMLNSWKSDEGFSPLVSLARAFSWADLSQVLAAKLKVEHILFLSAQNLETQLAGYDLPDVLSYDISGQFAEKYVQGEISKFSAKDSKGLKVLWDTNLVGLELRGTPSLRDIRPLLPNLEWICLSLQAKPDAMDLFSEPWLQLRELTLKFGTSSNMLSLIDNLPILSKNLPHCQSLTLNGSTNRKTPLMESLCESPWIANLRAFHLGDEKLTPGKIDLLAQIPFTNLEYLGISAIETLPQIANVLAKSEYLAPVKALEIPALIGKSGLRKIISSWSKLEEIRLLDPPCEEEELIKTFDLNDFIEKGGRICSKFC